MKEELIILGTGNAIVTRCFNTCFAIKMEDEYFLVDAGGGNGILTQLEKAQIPLECIHEIFLSHAHTDHVLGLIWVIRMIGSRMLQKKYDGNLNLYCHKELTEIIKTICRLTLSNKLCSLFDERILFHEVENCMEKVILGRQIVFFDILSTKEKQFGFMMKLRNGKKLTFTGDEPYREHEYEYAYKTGWLLHEAFCLYQEREKYKPYEKHHTTVKEACEWGNKLKADNLILYHTEDDGLKDRKERYTKEGKRYYQGNLIVPDDLERFVL